MFLGLRIPMVASSDSPFSSVSRNFFPLTSSKPSVLVREPDQWHFWDIFYMQKKLITVPKITWQSPEAVPGCIYCFPTSTRWTLSPWILSLPPLLSLEALVSERWWARGQQSTSSLFLLLGWVPGNWQAMWIFHTNYSCTISFFLTMAPGWFSWLLVGFSIYFQVIFYKLNICFVRNSKMSLLCDLLTCKLFSRVTMVLEASHLYTHCSVPLSLVHLWSLHHVHWQRWMQNYVPFHRVL